MAGLFNTGETFSKLPKIIFMIIKRLLLLKKIYNTT